MGEWSDTPTPGGIVFLAADWPWPPTTGGRIRDASIATALEQVGPLTVLSPDRPRDERDEWTTAVRALHAPRSTGQKVVRHLRANLLGRGLLLERAISVGLADAFERHVQQWRPTVVVLGAPYFGPFIDVARREGARVVLSAGEGLFRANGSVALTGGIPRRRRLRAALDAVALGRLERRDYRRVDQVWVSSELERRALAPFAGQASMHVIPNVPPVPIRDTPCSGEITAVAYVGSFGHPPNQAAAMELIREIMPAVRAAGGPTRLALIGRDPTPAMVAAARRDTDTTITGAVADIAPLLCSAGVLVVPLRSGAGTRIKILEAASLGVPVISTAFGAEGLELRHGREVLNAETPAEFAACVMSLVRSADRRQQLVAGAQEAVKRRHSQAAVDASVGAALRESARLD